MKYIHENITQVSKEGKRQCRDSVELLRKRLSLLDGRDKVLMTMYLENGNSFRQIARLTGSNTASVARRVHKLTERLIDGEYITCLRNRDRFTQTEMEIAKDYFLMGSSIRKIAARQSCSYYFVRQSLKKIQRLVRVIEVVRKFRPVVANEFNIT